MLVVSLALNNECEQSHSQALPSTSRTLQEVIPTGARMRNDPFKITVAIKNNTISSRTSASIDSVAAQDWELLIRARIREAKPLVVVVGVGVIVVADRLARLVVVAPLLDGGVDVGLRVAGRATSVGALPLVNNVSARKYEGL